MKFEAVTTCSAKGWKEYGDRMIGSFHKHWPDEVGLRLFSEDPIVLPEYLTPTQPMPKWLNEFKARHKLNKAAHGEMRRGRYRTQYNYRFDAVRFAHKVAVVIEAARTTKADILIWVDADTVTHASVTMEFLESLAPTGDQVIAWLNRDKNYPECGFYMLNMRSTLTLALLQQWQALYTSDNLFHLPEWHDSYVLADLVKALGYKWKSLSGTASNTSHPFINGPLGAVMDHLKGSRKAEGKSRRLDLKIERTEPYWRAR